MIVGAGCLRVASAGRFESRRTSGSSGETHVPNAEMGSLHVVALAAGDAAGMAADDHHKAAAMNVLKWLEGGSGGSVFVDSTERARVGEGAKLC